MPPRTTQEGPDLAHAPLEAVLAALGTQAEAGLSAVEVDARVHRFGPNEVPEPKPHPLRDVLKKFWGPSASMLPHWSDWLHWPTRRVPTPPA